VNRIHATHFWGIVLSTLANFIDCGNGSDIRMGASTLFSLLLSASKSWNLPKVDIGVTHGMTNDMG
jgi:hypothetical protein